MTNANDPMFGSEHNIASGLGGTIVANWKHLGLTKREFLAAMALEGILVGCFGDRPTAKPTPEKVAAQAVAYADALIAELSKQR